MPVVQVQVQPHPKLSQHNGDSGHETLLSDDDSPTPTVERASSEVIYSTIPNGNHHLVGSRTRRSLAESNSTCINIKSNILNNNFTTIEAGNNHTNNSSNNNNNNEEEHPPMIGVPNLKGKALIKPIAFRPTPGPNSGASTPTNGPTFMHGGPFMRPGSSNGPESLHGLTRASPAGPVPAVFGTTPTNEGFAPGHPLVKDGRRHYGSSQELHVSAPTNPAFSKFNSLDRRALNKRNSQNSGGNGLLKIATSGPDSLPVRPLLKEPERRHSSYDPKSRPSLGNGPVKQQPQSAININGLPDPFSNKIYSSQESINRSTNNGTPLRPNSSTGSTTRASAGTPQFQNLSGTIRTSANGLIPSNSSVNNVANSSNNRTTLTSLYHNSGSTNGNSAGSTTEMNQTPSPSDSAVGDLETMLKEKDTEINYLRETMEQNEQVIFKVYEEKEKMWERELRKIKGLYDNRLRASQQKSSKMEQALTNQTYQLQNEKRRLEKDLEEIKKQKEEQDEENQKLRDEVASLRKLLENPAEGPAVSGSISIGKLTTVAAVAQSETEKRRLEEMVANAKLAAVDLQEKEEEIEKLQNDLGNLITEVKELKSEASISKETFETEKSMWLDEKEKVIRYQKQLQLNYVQMYKRNKTLESEIESLHKTVEEVKTAASMAKQEAQESTATPSKKSQSSAASRLQKTSNSVRARLFKMSLHSESQC